MGRGLKLFRVLGIQISIDYTWFIVFIFFAWTLAYGYFPYMNPGLEQSVYLGMGFFSSLALFACVLAHEISHSYTSNKLGHEVKEITLFIFGGVAQLTKEPDNAKDELKIAAAGPVMSAFLAAVFYGADYLVPDTRVVASAILQYLALINVVLLVFNLIPGFPLDGGRVLRAALWWKWDDVAKATRVATQIGKGFALFLIITGFMRIFTGNFIGGLWSVLIGVFLQQAAESGYRQIMMKTALEGVKVREIMSHGAVSVRDTIRVSETVTEYFLPYHYVSFPVVDSSDRLVGLVTLNNVRSLDKDEWVNTTVREIMHELTEEEILHPGENAEDILPKMGADMLGRFPVVDNGRLVGMVTRRDIMKVLQFQKELRR